MVDCYLVGNGLEPLLHSVCVWERGDGDWVRKMAV